MPQYDMHVVACRPPPSSRPIRRTKLRCTLDPRLSGDETSWTPHASPPGFVESTRSRQKAQYTGILYLIALWKTNEDGYILFQGLHITVQKYKYGTPKNNLPT